MNCKEFSDLLDAYLDGELTPEEETALRDHAALCPDCAARLLLLEDSRRLDEDVDAPEAFSAAWRKAVQKEKEAHKVLSLPRVRRYLAAAAALVLVAGGALLAWRSRPPLQPLPAVGNAAALKTSGMTPAATMMPMATSAPNRPTETILFSAAVANSNTAMDEEVAPEEMEAEEAAFMEDTCVPMEAWVLDAEEDTAEEAAPAAAMMEKAADTAAETAGEEPKLVILTSDPEADRAALAKLAEALGGSMENAPEEKEPGEVMRLRADLPREQGPVFLAEARKLGAVAEGIGEDFALSADGGKDGRVRISVILRRAQ